MNYFNRSPEKTTFHSYHIESVIIFMLYLTQERGDENMHIAICEDNIYTIKELKACVSDFMVKKNLAFDIDSFTTAGEFFNSSKDYDLILMDYSLPDSNGIEIAKQIRLTNKRTTIVFITAFSEYVFDSFEVNTFRYLLKPVKKDQLYKMLNAFTDNFEQFSKIEIPLISETAFVNLSEIMYFESSGRYTTVRLNSTSYVSTKALTAFQADISSFRFFRTHRAYLVNMKYIAEIDGHIITLTNGEKIEISRRNLGTFNKCYMNFLKYSDM